MTETERMLEPSQQRQEAATARLRRDAEAAEAQSDDLRGRLQRSQAHADADEVVRERDAAQRRETALAAALRRIADFEPDPANGGDRDQEIAGFAKLTAAYALGRA